MECRATSREDDPTWKELIFSELLQMCFDEFEHVGDALADEVIDFFLGVGRTEHRAYLELLGFFRSDAQPKSNVVGDVA